MAKAKAKPVLTHVTYRPKKGKEAALFALVKKHWPTLRKTGLVTAKAATVYRAHDKRSGADYFIEIFSWRDEQAAGLAHQTPEVMAVWEPMGPIMEGMEIAAIEPVGAKSRR
jgi:quinol monooxygenase YgiN